MKVITIESEAFQALVDKIDSLSQLIDIHQHKVNPDEAWVNSDDVCTYLGISQRTLQRLRTNDEITYSLLAGKAYYTISEVKRLLETRKVRSTAQSVDELCDAYKKRIKSIQSKAKL